MPHPSIQNLWNDAEAREFSGSDLELRVYTSRLLGRNEDLVLHGGGNTSVKATERNIFGEDEEILKDGDGASMNLGLAMQAVEADLRLEQKAETDESMVEIERSVDRWESQQGAASGVANLPVASPNAPEVLWESVKDMPSASVSEFIEVAVPMVGQ